MSANRRAVVAVTGVIAAVVGGGVAWAVTAHDSGGPTGYASARAMAVDAGCLGTFRPLPAYVGTLSAGTCVIRGAVVTFVTTATGDAAAAWDDGVRVGARAAWPGAVGSNWAAVTPDAKALPKLSHS